MKKMIASLGLAMGAFLCAAPASAAIVVALSPSSQHVNIGDSVTVTASISGLGDEVLSAMDLNLLFNGGILTGTGAGFFAAQFGAPDAYFDTTFNAGDTGVIAGSLLDDASLAALQDNSFDFLSYVFTASANGVTNLTYGPDVDFQRNFVGLNFASLDVVIRGACVAVGTGTCDQGGNVPEPASFGLAGVALLAAGVAGRTRRRQRAA